MELYYYILESFRYNLRLSSTDSYSYSNYCLSTGPKAAASCKLNMAKSHSIKANHKNAKKSNRHLHIKCT